MSISDLYQQTILEHSKHPKNFGILEHPTHSAHGKNTLCGDELYLTLVLEGTTIQEIKFQGEGCAISKSSASLMTAAILGKSIEEAQTLLNGFVCLLTEEGTPGEVGKLAVFSGVKEYPSRVKCAMLAWRTLESALQNGKEVSTE